MRTQRHPAGENSQISSIFPDNALTFRLEKGKGFQARSSDHGAPRTIRMAKFNLSSCTNSACGITRIRAMKKAE